MLIDINEDLKKYLLLKVKVEIFWGRTGKGGGRSLFYYRKRTQRCFRDELAMGRNLQFPTYKVLMALENVFKVLPSSLIQPCDNKHLISQEKMVQKCWFVNVEGFNLNFTQCCYTFG